MRKARAVCPAQVAFGGAQRLDQAIDGFSAVQCARSAQGSGRVGPGVSGAQHQADAGASGGVKRGKSAPLGLLTRPMSRAERPDPPDSWRTTPKMLGEK